ncbi:MAG: hypothetical protein ACR2QZ_09465 [Woeseiaceae bacterium]
MTRSPLAYPLNRSADMDAGGAADLQTDIMRFMAILSLCLVAIFALVQSIPLEPSEPARPAAVTQEITAARDEIPEEKAIEKAIVPPAPVEVPTAAPVAKTVDEAVVLTRPKWVPRFLPRSSTTDASIREEEPQQSETIVAEVEDTVEALPPIVATVEDAVEARPPVESQSDGFVLRFESDAALTRLVATNRIGFYALGSGRAQRMTVRDSRISFWDASTPNTYHEMEAVTVPDPVIQALTRSGTSSANVSWGVTLPGPLKTQLDELMLEHNGGSLIIVASGEIRWEAS